MIDSNPMYSEKTNQKNHIPFLSKIRKVKDEIHVFLLEVQVDKQFGESTVS